MAGLILSGLDPMHQLRNTAIARVIIWRTANALLIQKVINQLCTADVLLHLIHTPF